MYMFGDDSSGFIQQEKVAGILQNLYKSDFVATKSVHTISFSETLLQFERSNS